METYANTDIAKLSLPSSHIITENIALKKVISKSSCYDMIKIWTSIFTLNIDFYSQFSATF